MKNNKKTIEMEELATIDLPNRRYNKFILEYRKDAKISQKELAEIIGISQPVLSQVENGINPMKMSTFLSYCNKIGIDSSKYIK